MTPDERIRLLKIILIKWYGGCTTCGDLKQVPEIAREADVPYDVIYNFFVRGRPVHKGTRSRLDVLDRLELFVWQQLHVLDRLEAQGPEVNSR